MFSQVLMDTWTRYRNYFFNDPKLLGWDDIEQKAIRFCLEYSELHSEPKALISCVKNNQLDRKMLKKLALDGSIFAINLIGFLSKSLFKRWNWFGKLLEFKEYLTFINILESFVYLKKDDINLVYIGRHMRRKVEFNLIFQLFAKPAVVLLSENSASAYKTQMIRCRKAVDAWTLVGLRFRVVKDIRNLIAKLIWESRNEEIYF